MNNGSNCEAKVTNNKRQKRSAKNITSTEGYLKVNDKRNYDRVNNGNNNETKVTHDKGQKLDCLKKVSNINEKIWIKENVFYI